MDGLGMEARKASGQGGSVDLKKEKLKIRTVILSGGTIRCDVPSGFFPITFVSAHLKGSILLQILPGFLTTDFLFFFAVLESIALLRPPENAYGRTHFQQVWLIQWLCGADGKHKVF